ncbi:MAG: hypothetical protein K0R57_816 [Paenibacillaceae bacterium]|jgi:spore germination protein (amino acid permease)|nr:hypothetical protein [Paenibacillaceae bacterium]
MKSPKPTLLSAILVMMLTVGMSNHVFLIPALVEASQRDSWLALLLSSPAVFILVFVMMYISRAMSNEPLAQWFHVVTGPAPAYIFRVLISLYCLTNAYFTLYETTIWIRVNFLQNTPVIFTGVALMMICYTGARKGLRTIANASGILLPIVFLFGFSIAFINVKYKDYSQLFPLLEHGWAPLAMGGMYSLAGSFEILLILFIQPNLSSRLKLKPMLALAAIVVGFTMGPLIGALTEFNPYEARLVRFPAYEEWRLAAVGKFLAQTDFLSIFQWITGAFIRICFLLHVTAEMWNIKSEKKRSTFLLLVSTLFVLINMIPLSDMSMHEFTVAWVYPGNFGFLTGALLCLAAVAYFSRKRVRNKHGNEGTGGP